MKKKLCFQERLGVGGGLLPYLYVFRRRYCASHDGTLGTAENILNDFNDSNVNASLVIKIVDGNKEKNRSNIFFQSNATYNF